MYEEIKTKLQNFPQFRERRFRAEYLVILSLRNCGTEQKYKDNTPFTLQELTDFALKFNSYDRIWRWVLRENKELRGSDYEDKKIYEEEAELKLGYEVGYHQDTLKLKTL